MPYAKLAACAAALVLSPVAHTRWPSPPAEAHAQSLKISFQLADGVQLSGVLTAWNPDGFDGSFGPRRWIEIQARDVWRIQQRLIDPHSLDNWIALGRVLLEIAQREPAARSIAERAFTRARRLDPHQAEILIAQARSDAEAAGLELRRRRHAADAARLNTLSPEARQWPADPWPVLTVDQQQGAVDAIRAHAEQLLKHAGLSLAPLETEHFLLYSDQPRDRAAPWIMQCEALRDVLVTILARSHHVQSAEDRAGLLKPWGKIVLLVFGEHDRFRLVQAQAFNQLVPNGLAAISHPHGAGVLVSAHCAADQELFRYSLVRETVLALMHGHRSALRLPPWANEGLASVCAARMLPQSSVASEQRKVALAYIRARGDVHAVMSMQYADQSWPGPNAAGPAVGTLLVELLAREHPARLATWIDAVKDDEPWESALRNVLNTSRQHLATVTAQYYMVND